MEPDAVPMDVVSSSEEEEEAEGDDIGWRRQHRYDESLPGECFRIDFSFLMYFLSADQGPSASKKGRD